VHACESASKPPTSSSKRRRSSLVGNSAIVSGSGRQSPTQKHDDSVTLAMASSELAQVMTFTACS